MLCRGRRERQTPIGFGSLLPRNLRSSADESDGLGDLADVDLEDFDPLTIEWLQWVSRLWASDDLLAALQELLAYSAENERQLTVVENDILHMRNEHLLAEVERALGEYQNVVVPWGALHLPFIESAILERGFEETQRQRYRLLAWTTVLAAIL